MPFRWRADDGQILVLFGSTHPHKKKKKKKKRSQSWTSSEKTFWIRAWLTRYIKSGSRIKSSISTLEVFKEVLWQASEDQDEMLQNLKRSQGIGKRYNLNFNL